MAARNNCAGPGRRLTGPGLQCTEFRGGPSRRRAHHPGCAAAADQCPGPAAAPLPQAGGSYADFRQAEAAAQAADRIRAAYADRYAGLAAALAAASEAKKKEAEVIAAGSAPEGFVTLGASPPPSGTSTTSPLSPEAFATLLAGVENADDYYAAMQAIYAGMSPGLVYDPVIRAQVAALGSAYPYLNEEQRAELDMALGLSFALAFPALLPMALATANLLMLDAAAALAASAPGLFQAALTVSEYGLMALLAADAVDDILTYLWALSGNERAREQVLFMSSVAGPQNPFDGTNLLFAAGLLDPNLWRRFIPDDLSFSQSVTLPVQLTFYAYRLAESQDDLNVRVQAGL